MNSGRPKTRARVMHMTRVEAKAAHLVECTVTIFGFVARVLFDSGASHSFVSEEFLDSLLELDMGVFIELVVELSMGDFPLTSYCLEEIVSHLVVYEVCKHKRKCLAKTMFLPKSSHTSMLPVFSQK
ncbi:hypothetical protein Taro_055113 [Colocasia esculenta]|uniref:Uncharacterized protein n=1 Tax=Colocasia esculenta TaxID=4460 RepID=A0A843XT77_COLES|nr:hypothetical protein [Colocasia esculenta]